MDFYFELLNVGSMRVKIMKENKKSKFERVKIF